MKKLNFKAYSAEILGTFSLVFIGCMTAIFTGNVVAVSMAFGLTVMVFAFVLGPISGAHFNPAVSLGLLIRKKINVKDFGFYIIAQLVGAALATFMIWLLTLNTTFEGSFAANGLNSFNEVTVWGTLILETLLTGLFVFVILTITMKKENSKVAPMVIGVFLMLAIALAFNFTGGSLNPTRSLFPALFTGGEALEQVWIFIVAPLLGGTIAAFVHPLLFKENEVDNQESEEV